MRIYSNYLDSEKDAIETEALSCGMSLSCFQKYCTLLYINIDPYTRNNVLPISALIKDMEKALSNLPHGTEFIISSLFPPEQWSNLSPSEKRTLAGVLKSKVVRDSTGYTIIGHKRGKINHYKKL